MCRKSALVQDCFWSWWQKRFVHSVGFEPTSTNTMQLECTPLDRSGTNASCFTQYVLYIWWQYFIKPNPNTFRTYNSHTTYNLIPQRIILLMLGKDTFYHLLHYSYNESHGAYTYHLISMCSSCNPYNNTILFKYFSILSVYFTT